MWVRMFRSGEKWIPGVVQKVLGATNYQVLLGEGQLAHRHIDQLKRRHVIADEFPEDAEFVHEPTPEASVPDVTIEDSVLDDSSLPPTQSSPVPVQEPGGPPMERLASPQQGSVDPQPESPRAVEVPERPVPRYGLRNREQLHPPVRLADYRR